jgi:hypothetical protein
MGCLKSFAVGILSFLLFLSLSLFGLVFMLNQTILNPNFVTTQINSLDLPTLAEGMIEEMVGEQVTGEGELMAEVMRGTLTDLQPWISEQTSTIVNSTYDYILGDTDTLNVVIPLTPVKDSLEDNLRQAILESPPAELAGLPPAQVDQYINQLSQQTTQDLPATFEFDESSIPADFQPIIEQVRQIVSYVQLAFWGLIGFMVVLVLGISLINWNVKRTTRSLGTTSLTYGVLGYAGIFATNRLLETQLSQFDVPPLLQAWLPQFIGDFLSPAEMFSIGLAVTGVVLIVVSIIYKRGAAA